MSKAAAQAYYDKQPEDGSIGYISASDAKNSINVIYTDIGLAIEDALSDVAPVALGATAVVGNSLQGARSNHVHPTTGLALVNHGHPISDITNLQSSLDGLQSALDGKADVGEIPAGGAAPANHTHPQSQITNLVLDLSNKAPLASPTFTGDPKAPTPSSSDNDTSIATTAFVQTVLSNHNAASDPHAGYQRETEKNQANGYVGLGATSKITASQLPLTFTNTVIATVFDTTKYLSLNVDGTVYKVALVQ